MTNKVLGIGVKTTYDGKGIKGASEDLEKLGGAGETAAKGTLTARQKFDLFKTTVGGVVAAGMLVNIGQQLKQLGSDSVAVASDVQEMQSKFNTVFKDLAGPVTAELEAFADAAGRSVYDLQGFAATLQDTFVPLGFARDAAADMSIELVKLAEDLASFNNLPTEQVVMDLQSALVGNTETLRKYGVVASQAAIDEKALAMGFQFTKGQMDAQTKASTILQIALDSTTDAQGDAIRTADSYANKTKDSEAATKDFMLALGNVVMPLANVGQVAKGQTLTALTELIEKMELVTKATNQANLMMSTSEYNSLAGELRDYGYSWRFLNDEVGQVESRFDLFRTEEEKMQEALMAQQGSRRLSLALEVLQSGFEGTEEELVALVNQLDANYERSALNAELRSMELVASQRVMADEAKHAAINFDALAMVTDELTYKGDDYLRFMEQQEAKAQAAADAEEEKLKIAQEYAELLDQKMNHALKQYVELNAQAAAVFQDDFITALSDGAPKVEEFNTLLLAQLDQMGASPEVYGLAAIALGEYDKEQVAAATNAAIIRLRIEELATQFNNGEISVRELREQMELISSGKYLVDVDTSGAQVKVSRLRQELEMLGTSLGRGSQAGAGVPETDIPERGAPVETPAKASGGAPPPAAAADDKKDTPWWAGQRAEGGPVAAGYSYPVGERGPEVFVPATSGYIIPNNQLGGLTINVTVNGQIAGSGRMLGKQIAATVATELGRLN